MLVIFLICFNRTQYVRPCVLPFEITPIAEKPLFSSLTITWEPESTIWQNGTSSLSLKTKNPSSSISLMSPVVISVVHPYFCTFVPTLSATSSNIHAWKYTLVDITLTIMEFRHRGCKIAKSNPKTRAYHSNDIFQYMSVNHYDHHLWINHSVDFPDFESSSDFGQSPWKYVWLRCQLYHVRTEL